MKVKTLAAAVGAALVFPLAATAAPVVSILPAIAPVAQGGAVTLTARVSGLTGGDPLTAFDLAIGFDTSRLSLALADVALSPDIDTFLGLGLGFFLDSESVAGGTAEVQVNSLGTDAEVTAAQAGVDAFDLFTMKFTAASVDAATMVDFASIAQQAPILTGLRAQAIQGVTYVGSCVVIGQGDPAQCGQTPVPEPASYGLAAIGLLAAGVAMRKKRRRRELVAA